MVGAPMPSGRRHPQPIKHHEEALDKSHHRHRVPLS